MKGRQPKQDFNEINKRLKDYMNFRQSHSIDSLIYTGKKTCKTPEPQASRYNVLFQKFQKADAHNEEQNQLIRQTNKEIDSPLFKHRLMHGLTRMNSKKLTLTSTFMRSEDHSLKKQPTKQDDEDAENAIFNNSMLSKRKSVTSKPKETPQKTSNKKNPSSGKSFMQLSHIFTPYGPARSQNSMQIKLIVSGNFKEQPTSSKYANVNTKNIAMVRNFLSKQKSSPSINSFHKLSQKSSAPRQDLVHKLWVEQVPFITSVPKPKRNVTDFVKLVKSINTMEMNLDDSKVPHQPSLTKQQISPVPISSPSGHNFFRSQRASTSKLLQSEEFMNSKKANTRERSDFHEFLNNKWLDFIIKTRAIVKNEDYNVYLDKYLNNAAQIKEDELKLHTHSEIRRQYKDLSRSSTMLRNQFTLGGDVQPQTYLARKVKKYAKASDHQIRINMLDDVVYQFEKRRDEEDLLEFHVNYKYPVLRKRLIRKLWFLARKAIQLGMNIYELIEKKMVNTRPFEQKGSFAFFEQLKSSDTTKISAMLARCPSYIYEFDELLHTPLFIAIKRNNVELAALLLQRGASVNVCDIFHLKPLMYAIQNDNLDSMRLLLSNGATPWDLRCGDYFRYVKSKPARTLLKISQYMDINLRCVGQVDISRALMQVLPVEKFAELISDLKMIQR